MGILKRIDRPICLALGFFDGVHLGHRAVMEKLKEVSAKHNADSTVFTFSDNPKPTLPLIYSFNDRKKIIEGMGVECISKEFEKVKENCEVSFIVDLAAEFNIAAFVCGRDYRFGKNAKGNTKLLKMLSRVVKIEVHVVPHLMAGEKKISSTLIKKHIENGEIEIANSLLGDNYFMKGGVVKGRAVGRMLGIPTLNLNVMPDIVQLKEGVYRTITNYDGKKYSSLTHIGVTKTFNSDKIACETHIPNIDLGDLYGKEIKVEFLSRLRDTIKFSSPQDLAHHIKTIDMQ